MDGFEIKLEEAREEINQMFIFTRKEIVKLTEEVKNKSSLLLDNINMEKDISEFSQDEENRVNQSTDIWQNGKKELNKIWDKFNSEADSIMKTFNDRIAKMKEDRAT